MHSIYECKLEVCALVINMCMPIYLILRSKFHIYAHMQAESWVCSIFLKYFENLKLRPNENTGNEILFLLCKIS